MSAAFERAREYRAISRIFLITCVILLASTVLFLCVAKSVRNKPSLTGLSDEVYKSNISDRFLLSTPGLPSFIDTISGLSIREPWGRWSDGDTVEFRFKSPLPRNFTLSLLESHVTQVNIGRPFIVEAGNIRRTFVISSENSLIAVHFEDAIDAYAIKIIIPTAQSTDAARRGGDRRLLGIGLGWIQISNS